MIYDSSFLVQFLVAKALVWLYLPGVAYRWALQLGGEYQSA